jgi:carbon monoxide dehydrogenase subunit G
MKIEKSFVVKSTPAAVWAFLTDPQRIARALPGAAIQEQIDPQTYTGTMTVKVGPVSTSYRGQVRFEQLDEAAGVAVIVATGQDVRGKGGADMRMTSHVVERAPGETEVNVVSDVNVSGILAQMGRGMIEQVGDQMFEIFTDAARVELEGNASMSPVAPGAPAAARAPAAEPIQVVSFGSKLVGRAVGRAMRRPGFWAVVVVVIIVVVWLSRL